METDIEVEILKKILENVDEGIHFIDKNGITRIYNHNMEKMEGMSQKSVIGKHFTHVFKDMNENNSTLLSVLKDGISIKNNIQKYLNKNGKEIVTINSTIPIKHKNEVIGSLEIAKNMTTIKTLYDEIVKLQLTNDKMGTNEIIKKQKKYEFEDIIGDSPKIKKVIEAAKKIAKNDAAILIYGETGTGKELLSQSIHCESTRKNAPFLAINCATLPDGLFEGILFGTAKGGFTGAIDKPGFFEQANRGTLLLDEINSIPIQIQAKLLRVLQEKVVRRVGGTEDIPIDVRVISTTNENPKEIIKLGKMRLDLYYRLNVIYLEMPPLRERENDVFLLAEKFIVKYNKKLNKNIKGITSEVKDIFLKYIWPGNVRELENIIYSGVVMSDENYLTKDILNMPLNDDFTIDSSLSKERDTDINFELKDDMEFGKSSLESIVSKLEERYIREAIEQNPNNLSKVAIYLGMSRQTLQYKLKKYNIKV